MYVPAHFAATDDDVRALPARPGAADLVTAGEHGLEATLLPFVHDPGRGGPGPTGDRGQVEADGDHVDRAPSGDIRSWGGDRRVGQRR
ncbi:FMN-binding negative transcriptional regulator [Pseudonocardia dioxanivorans]|uniref:FMN-binding negative transcriptional regulator n=1 Tax=Pseudonocardia dioxanivorans TaxID=240495 RepID=UPI0018F88D3B|nr:FMN-binding negative transcriptional regulator [Pseudonocardia dioxanivorans]